MFTGFRNMVVAALMMVTILPSTVAAAPSGVTYGDLLLQLQRMTAQLQVPSLNGAVLGVRTVLVSTPDELRAAIIAAQPGDEIQLAPGHYGRVAIVGGTYTQLTVNGVKGGKPPVLAGAVTITSQDKNKRAQFHGIEVKAANNWQFSDVVVRPNPTGLTQSAVILSGDNLRFERSVVLYGTTDASGWTATQWKERSGSGILVEGKNAYIADNIVANVYNGISVLARSEGTKILRNNVMHLISDGLRGLSNDVTFEDNVVKFSYSVNDAHNDAFQSFTQGADGSVGTGVISNVVVRGNAFINMTDTAHPLGTSFQGIGMFDGEFHNWLIEDNTIYTDHYHGISLYGAHNTVIRHNTVVDTNDSKPGPLWIAYFNHKNGTPPSNNVLENNIAHRFTYTSTTTEATGNYSLVYGTYDQLFVDSDHYNFTLQSGSAAGTAGARRMVNVAVPVPNIPVLSVNGTSTLPLPPDPEPEEPVPLPSDPIPLPVEPTPTPTSTEPTIQVTGLTKGQVVQGEVTVVVAVSGITNIKRVSYKLDRASAVTLTAPYSFTLKTAGLTDGQHKVTVTADGTEGSVSLQIPFKVVTTAPVPTKRNIKTTDNVNLRVQPLGEVMTVLSAGQVVTQTTEPVTMADGSQWIPVVTADGSTGYVSAAYTETVSTTLTVDATVTQLWAEIARLQTLLLKLLQTQ